MAEVRSDVADVRSAFKSGRRVHSEGRAAAQIQHNSTVHQSQTRIRGWSTIVHMTPDSLRQKLSDFLAGAHAAIVVEDGAVAFDLAESKYSISGEHNKCLLHLWSSERNVVRRVLDAE